MLIKFYDVDENRVKEVEEKVCFEYCGGSWKYVLDEIYENSIDKIEFKRKDVDKRVFVMLEDGCMIRLKDGRWFVACFSILGCRVCKEDEEEGLYWDEVFGIK